MKNNDALNMINKAMVENDMCKFAKTLDMVIFMNELYMFQLSFNDVEINIDIIDNLRDRIAQMLSMYNELYDIGNRILLIENTELYNIYTELCNKINKHCQELRSFYM